MAEPTMERTWEKPMLLPARSRDGGDRPSARWKSLSLPETVCFEPVGDSGCPCRGCRECGRVRNSEINQSLLGDVGRIFTIKIQNLTAVNGATEDGNTMGHTAGNVVSDPGL